MKLKKLTMELIRLLRNKIMKFNIHKVHSSTMKILR